MEQDKNKKVLNLFPLIHIIWHDKKQICAYSLGAAIIGVIIAFSIPRIYKTKIMLAPESSSSSSFSNMSSLAAMIGYDINFGNGQDAFFPEIYPDLINSTDFLVTLFPIKVQSKDGKIKESYYNYIRNYQKNPWWDYPMAWLIEVLKKKDDVGSKGKAVDPFNLTKEQYKVAMHIANNISCKVDRKTNVISIEVTDQDPLISATMADSIRTKLQQFITDYRTQKARNDLSYFEDLCSKAKEQYVKARQQYGSYSDINQDLVLQSYRSKTDDLENEMQLRYNIYTQVVQQLQLAQAKLQERTPAFSVLQSASVPIKHSNKPKILYLFFAWVIGFLGRVSFLIYSYRAEIFV